MMSFSQEILKIISLYLLPFSSKSRSKSQVVCSHTYCGCFQSSEKNLPRAGNIRLYCAQELLVYYLFSTLPQTGPAGQAGVQPASLGGLTFGNCDSFSLSLLYCTSTRLPYIRQSLSGEKMTSFILPISLFYHLFTFTNQTMKMGENIQENQIQQYELCIMK